MENEIIKRAGEFINSISGGIGDGMLGFLTISVIDEDGFPNASTATVARNDGIKTITILSGLDSNKVKRLLKNNKASICFSLDKHNISLVGTAEILTDLKSKQENWYDAMTEMGVGPESDAGCVIKFTTMRYNIFFADDMESTAVGKI